MSTVGKDRPDDVMDVTATDDADSVTTAKGVDILDNEVRFF